MRYWRKKNIKEKIAIKKIARERKEKKNYGNWKRLKKETIS